MVSWLTALVIVTYYVFFSHVIYCQTIQWSGFRMVSDHLYLSPGVKSQDEYYAKGVVQLARQRNRKFWGQLQGEPVYIWCATAEEYERYCQSSEGAGCSLGTPFGQTYIILNPSGANVDVVSHELCHSELFSRLGWWKTTVQIPQWFNEGLALMLDYRFVASADSVERFEGYYGQYVEQLSRNRDTLRLSEIASIRGFFGGGKERVMLAYMTAGLEMSYLLRGVGNSGLVAFVDQVRSGGDFSVLYKELQASPPLRRESIPAEARQD